MVDFSTYQPPGVYVEEETTSLVAIGGTSTTVVAIVGPALGYRSATEVLVLTGSDPVALANQGINTSVDFVITTPTGTVITSSEYVVTVTGSGTTSQTSIARSEDSDILDGGTVYVSYRYTDAAYSAPTRVNDYDDVEALFGPALNLTTNEIISPLTLAAKFAFDNGAQTLVLVPTGSADQTMTTSALTAAYARLNTFSDVSIIVPLPVGMTGTDDSPGDLGNVGAGLLTYLNSSAAEDLLRIGIVGLDRSASADPAALVANYASRRMMHAHPNRMLFYNGNTNSTLEISGYYLAAAFAGRFAGLGVSEPLTKKTIRGFSGIPASVASTMTKTKKNTWSNLGVAVAEITSEGSLVVRHGTSTDRSNLINREVSLVRARDALVNLLRETLNSSGLIGSYIETDTTTRIQGVIEGILETARSLDYLISYNSVKVRQRAGLPSVIDVKFQYRPAYPLNYISVTFAVDTTTGEVTTDETTTATTE